MVSPFPTDLRDLIGASVLEMTGSTAGLESYQLQSVGPSSSDTVAIVVAAVLGYSGDKIKGSVVVVSDKNLLDKSHPNHAMGMPVTEADLSDWAGEVSNQILGRIKNKMALAEVKFNMATPTVVTGKSMQINPPKDGYAMQFNFAGPHGAFVIHFLTVFDPSLSFAVAQSSGSAKEGESLLF